MKKLPYGISDYELLITDNHYYVDKTMYLEKLENAGDTLVFLRPRRFGKTLFASMMYYYYDLNSKDRFEELFKDTYVYNNPTKYKNSYYVLRLDFSGMNGTEEEVTEYFKNKVIIAIKGFVNKYNFDYVINEEKRVTSIFMDFLSWFQNLYLDNKIYVIIDEYDNFTNSILENSIDSFKNFFSNDGFLKNFYALIKEYQGYGVIDRVFITGVCSLTLDSMTSGFNTSTDITNDIRFNSMLGLSYEEVYKLISGVENKEEVFEILKSNYDGYLFNEDADERVFNSTLVLHFLSYYFEFNEYPEELVDKNITPNYKQIRNVVMLQNNKFYKEILDTILKEKEIISELRGKFSLDLPLTRNDVISLLYYFGFLTIKEGSLYTKSLIFKIPNNVINEVYNDYFLSLLSEIDIEIDEEKNEEFIKEIVETGRIDKLTNYVEEILKLSDNKLFIKFDEKYIQLLYFCLLTGNKEFSVYNEYQCSNGYIDLMILGKSNLCKNDIMIELKYIKQKDYNNGLFKRIKKEGTEQLESYSEDERISKDTKKYLVVFVGSKLKLLEEI